MIDQKYWLEKDSVSNSYRYDDLSAELMPDTTEIE